MSPPSPPGSSGLCAGCLHARVIEAHRGQTYLLCRMSEQDPRFPRYPPLPVIACPGFEGDEGTAGESDAGNGPSEGL